MLTLPNVATADAYTDRCTLGPVSTAQQIVFVVANAAVLAQIAPLNANGTLGDWEQDEILLTPQSNTLQRAGGIRFRSAVAGVPAQVVAQLITPADPVPGAGTPFTARLSGSGGVTPGAAAVQIQKNGALVGTEPALDFIDAGTALAWALTDDPANTRVTLALPKLITGRVNADGSIAGGTGFTVVNTAAGNYTVTFGAAFAVVPAVILMPVAGGSARFFDISALAVGSFSCLFATSALASVNTPFNFLAMAVS